MRSCATQDGLFTESVSYNILVRGEVDESLHLRFPGLMLASVEGDTLLSGVFPHREHLFELLQRLADAGIEFLSASALPPDDLRPTA